MFPSLSSVVSEFCIVLPENPTGEEGRILNFSVSKPLAYMNPEALRYIAKMKRERDLLALFQQELHLFLSEKKKNKLPDERLLPYHKWHPTISTTESQRYTTCLFSLPNPPHDASPSPNLSNMFWVLFIRDTLWLFLIRKAHAALSEFAGFFTSLFLFVLHLSLFSQELCIAGIVFQLCFSS